MREFEMHTVFSLDDIKIQTSSLLSQVFTL